ncbi:7TM-DISM domain-containing protein [Variovorax sp. PCZ-1]|uniref:sensor domain-containing diguanylate cyclase n=1 Tax=Variovorax sp. PCZ-1 TaxID=2835533 RepID=UPI001BCBE0C0|nr:7TM-DISM domain-containing protein [Variovorax sp. PCZ-1]MBS7806871.1 diguanylate cyclase [Variovorax sp. PCZ-1]
MQQAQAQTAPANPSAPSYKLPSLFVGQAQLDLEVPLGVLSMPSDKAPNVAEFLQSPLADQFKPWYLGMTLPTSSSSDVWLRLQLPQQNPPQSWMLRIPRLTLEKATFYQRSTANPGQWLKQVAGTDVPNMTWPIRARDPIFEVTTRSDQTQVLFIHIENTSAVTENIQLIRSSDFGNGANYAGTLNGLIIGIFTMLTLIGLVSWRLNQNSHFAWFALFSFSVMLAQLTVSGYMIMRIWPNSVYLARIMGWVLPFLSLAAMTRFVMSVSYSRDLSRPIYYMQWALIGFCGLMSLGFMLEPAQTLRTILNPIFATGMLVLMGTLAWIAWRSQHWLWMIFASLVPVVISVLARLAYNQGWVAHMELALLGGVIAATLGLILAYAALVANQRQRLSIAQRDDALETTDATTGLFNERIALARFPQIILRSKRFGNSCGAILVSWIGHEAVMTEVNSLERGRILSHLGGRLNRLARDIDTVARFSDDQFLFLVEAPVSHEQLSALASKILTTCMRPSKVMPEQKGFDLHIAVWLSSETPADADGALELLKTRINQMRDGTQRRVQFISSSLSTRPVQDASDPEHGQRLVQKINELEKTHGLPTIDLKSRMVKQNPADAS